MQLEIVLIMFMMSEQAISRNIHPCDMLSTHCTCTQHEYGVNTVQWKRPSGKMAGQACIVSTLQLCYHRFDSVIGNEHHRYLVTQNTEE